MREGLACDGRDHVGGGEVMREGLACDGRDLVGGEVLGDERLYGAGGAGQDGGLVLQARGLCGRAHRAQTDLS